MQSKTVALAGGAVAIVGAALAGGYYFGRGQQAPAPAPVAQTQPPNTTTAQQSPPDRVPSDQAQSAQQPAMQPPYESARYSSAPNDRAPHRRLSRASFHEALAPYGRWQYSDRWGEVWQPKNVEQDFRPYDRHGRWTNTREYGWTWVSDYEWGSIPFHYGRWVADPDRGWLWVPGYVWGPGWVVWRSGGRHTGWMPMPPDREFARGDETYRNDWRDDSGYGYRDWYGPRYDEQKAASLWIFVDTGHVADRDYRRYEVSRTDEVQNLISHTSNVTNYATLNNHVVNQSIDVHAVEQASGHKVEAVPASAVLAKPELVTSVDVGKQAQIQARQDVPTGSGKPNSAPPPSQLPASGQPATTQAGAQSAQSGNNPATTGAATTAAAKPGDENQHARHEEHGSATTDVATTPATPAGNENRHARDEEHGSAALTATSGGEAGKGSSGVSQQTGAGSANTATSNPTATKAGETPTKEAAAPATPGKGAPVAETAAKPGTEGIENWRKRRHPEAQQTAPEGNKAAASGAGPATSSGPAAPDAAAANGESPRLGHRPGRRAAMDSNPLAKPVSDSADANGARGSDAAGNLPRGGSGNENQSANSGPDQNSASSPSEHPRKHRLVVPASVEPNSHKNSESAPATDVRTEAPPTTESGKTDEEHPGKKGRHKSDEPGPANAPP